MKDISKVLTVFVVSSGRNPNYNACLSSLSRQTCTFQINIIKDFSPMSRAFQEMLNRVDTPYYIECDEDMILNQNAIEKMYNEIAGSLHNSMTAMHCYMLRDAHLDMPIYGIKIYKTDIFKKYPYNLDHPSCEMEQLDRVTKDGYQYRMITDVVGEHSPHWSNKLIFERYYNLMEKFKIYRYIWMEKLPLMLLNKIKENPSDKNIFALSGAMASIFSKETMDSEKDSRATNENYGKIKGYLAQPNQCTLYITSSCNFKCEFCYRQHNEIEKAPDMDTYIVDMIIKKFPSVQGYCICGFGEPLLSPNLIPILQKLKMAKKRVGIITNGSCLGENLNFISGWYQPDYISVSLNAHRAEEHAAITGTNTWNKVISAIKALVNSNIPVFTSSVVHNKNISYLPDLIRFVHSLGVQTLHLHNLLPHFSSDKNADFWNLVLTEDHLFQLNEARKMPQAEIVKKWPVTISQNRGRGDCDFPFYSFAVNGNGSLSFCNSVLPCDAKYGNIKDFVVWNSQAAQDFREKFCKRDIPSCSMCFRDWQFDGRVE